MYNMMRRVLDRKGRGGCLRKNMIDNTSSMVLLLVVKMTQKRPHYFHCNVKVAFNSVNGYSRPLHFHWNPNSPLFYDRSP